MIQLHGENAGGQLRSDDGLAENAGPGARLQNVLAWLNVGQLDHAGGEVGGGREELRGGDDLHASLKRLLHRGDDFSDSGGLLPLSLSARRSGEMLAVQVGRCLRDLEADYVLGLDQGATGLLVGNLGEVMMLGEGHVHQLRNVDTMKLAGLPFLRTFVARYIPCMEDESSELHAFAKIICALADRPQSVQVDVVPTSPGKMSLRVTAPGEELGRIIGTHGRSARALRTLLTAVGRGRGKVYTLDIVDVKD